MLELNARSPCWIFSSKCHPYQERIASVMTSSWIRGATQSSRRSTDFYLCSTSAEKSILQSMVTQIKTPKLFPLRHENKPLIALDEDDGGKCKQEWVCQTGQVPTEPKTQTSQENDKYNDSKPFISSHFTKLFLYAWVQGWIYSCPRKKFPNMASYKSTTSYLRYLQPQHQTATKYDTMVVAVKKQCQSKNRQRQKQLAKQGIVRCKVFR